ncbi:uncharacterized protein LOC142619466 [Castanea sativa]|uniref:uncharacterized protein LOC142619466 n=1 Tax=Castanea sativa TaxID=21020 RepID=UPI003F653A78
MASAEGSDHSDPTNTQTMQPVSNSNTETNSPNPFLLSASENPGHVLVTQPLLGMKNYQSWSRAMVLALTAKKKIGFVNGKIEKPEIDSSVYEDWESCNTMVLSWLINSMHVDVSSSIMYCETTREMWLELQRVFSQENGPKIYNLQQEISQITQCQLSVTEYYSKFKKLWDQFLHYEPLPACTCGAMKILRTAHEKSYVMRFLMGLNENFETVRSHILMLEPFPSMSKVYALILQEESHKGIGHGQGSTFTPKPNSVAMYVNTRGNSGSKGGPKKDRPLCTHCNMLGHMVDKCYKLHGYPPGYKHKGKINASANQVTYPQGASDASAQCPITKAQCEQLLAFFNSGLVTDQGYNHHAASVSTSGGVSGLVTEACGVSAATGVSSPSDHANSNFINTMSGTTSNFSFKPTLQHSIFSAKVVDTDHFHTSDWVIDTGATDHMVHSVTCFTSITTTLNTHVNLPNGETALVTHIGTVKISAKLTLYNVLCVPSFSFNLISVSQLAKSTSCCLIFFGTLCFIQDLAHWSTLGLGKECNGLYLLERGNSTSHSMSVSVSAATSLVHNTHVWHSRLGHLSNDKLVSIRNNGEPLCTSIENFACEICPLAKQKRLPFNKSSQISSACFDLIHCDLWGPFSVSTIDNCKYFLTIVDDCSRCT